jgi:hypothetical protein
MIYAALHMHPWHDVYIVVVEGMPEREEALGILREGLVMDAS